MKNANICYPPTPPHNTVDVLNQDLSDPLIQGDEAFPSGPFGWSPADGTRLFALEDFLSQEDNQDC